MADACDLPTAPCGARGQDWSFVIKDETFTLGTLLNNNTLAAASFNGGVMFTVRLVRSTLAAPVTTPGLASMGIRINEKRER